MPGTCWSSSEFAVLILTGLSGGFLVAANDVSGARQEASTQNTIFRTRPFMTRILSDIVYKVHNRRISRDACPGRRRHPDLQRGRLAARLECGRPLLRSACSRSRNTFGL